LTFSYVGIIEVDPILNATGDGRPPMESIII
jgi:hypothetical protein